MRFCTVMMLLLSWGSLSAVSATVPRSPYRIGVLYWSMNIPGQVAMRRGLEREAGKINRAPAPGPGVELIVRVAGDGIAGIERQIGQMNELIDLKVDMIIVQPSDNAALSLPLRKANRKNIPVIAYDQYICDGDLASYVTTDNYLAGYLGGEYLASLFPPEKVLNIAMVEYPHVSSTVERVDGFRDALRDRRRQYLIRHEYQAIEPVRGKLVGQQILRDFPDPGSLDVVFTVNDGGGLAIFEILARAGRREIAGITIDGDPRSVEIIRAGGIIKNDSAQFCGMLGAVALRTGYDYLNGKDTPHQILIPPFP
ncbi:MAG: sugar ABC transporter substrate-binding protein, partial [Victivallales bacterium]|nr:sugar ABC transporter substrate-binding protein [Victivallales bacterium]